MKVLLVAPFRLEGTGGIATIVRCLHGSLKERGYEVLSLLADDTDTAEEIRRAEWDAVYGIYLRIPFISDAIAKGLLAFWFYLPRTLWSLGWFLRRKHIEIVHITYPSASLFYFAILRCFSPWKLVVSLQGSDANRFGDQDSSSRWLVKSLLMSADVITACSESIRNKLDAISSELLTKTVVVPNANPIGNELVASPVSDALPENFILSVGSLINRKGHDVLIRAVSLAKERGYLIPLVIVGGGPEAANLSNLARDLGVSEQIQFAGEVRHSSVHAYYSKCRYFVLATRAEGMPLTLLEAMTLGKPVVATAVDGIPEIVTDEETGLLVPPEDAAALANALLRLERDGSLRDRLSKQARTFVLREHTWDRLTERYIEIYEHCLGKNRSEKQSIAGRK